MFSPHTPQGEPLPIPSKGGARTLSQISNSPSQSVMDSPRKKGNTGGLVQPGSQSSLGNDYKGQGTSTPSDSMSLVATSSTESTKSADGMGGLKPSGGGGEGPGPSPLGRTGTWEQLKLPVGECRHWPERDKSENIYESVLDCWASQVLDLFFSNDRENDIWDVYNRSEPNIQPFLNDSYTRTNWELSREKCCAVRAYRFKSKTVNLPFGMGSGSTRIVQTHRASRPSERSLLYHTRAEALDVPYGDSFVVDTRWHFEDSAAGPRCSIKVYVEVVFVRPNWVQGIIRKSALEPAVSNTRAAAKLLGEMAHKMKREAGQLPVSRKNLYERKFSIAERVQEMPKREYDQIFHPRSRPPASTLATLLPPHMTVVAHMLLLLAVAASWLALHKLEQQNAALFRELALVANMLAHGQCDGGQCDVSSLPADSLARHLAQLAAREQTTSRIMADLQAKQEVMRRLLHLGGLGPDGQGPADNWQTFMVWATVFLLLGMLIGYTLRRRAQ